MLIQYAISGLFVIVAQCVREINGEYQTSLTFNDILPEDPKLYDKMRPPKKDGQPTSVAFHVTVMGLDSIDENSMTYAADIFFAQTWKDHRLRLPENMTSEYRLLEVDWLKNIWRPDSFFKNAKSVTFQTMTIPNHYIWLYRDKTILYMVKLTLKLSCAMNFLIYPHDTQECKLQMESLSHTTDDMVFRWDEEVPLVVDEHIELPQLALVKNYTADCTQVYSTGNFTCLEVVFVLKRRLGYYLFHTYIPTCLIVIMSWVSFWIKPEAAPARVTLGVTSLLTLSTQHAKSQASLPPVSYLKAVDAFMSVCTVFVFMALMEYCLVNIVLGDSDPPSPKPHPPKLDKFFDFTAKNGKRNSKSHEHAHEHPITTFQRQESTLLLSPVPHIQTIPPPPCKPASAIPKLTPAQMRLKRAINIDRFSRIFFPFLFTLLNVTYWIMFYEYIISDDEDDTHPNIDTPSLFRWRHQARVERMQEQEKEKETIESKKKSAAEKLKDAKEKLQRNEGNLDELKKSIEELEKEQSAINKKPEELTEEQKELSLRDFIKKNEKQVKKFGMLRKYDDSKKFLQDNHHLVCEDTPNYLVIWCIELEMQEKHDLMGHVAHQCICMQYILDISKQLEVDPRSCVASFFQRIQEAEAKAEYKQHFFAEIEAFKERIRKRAQEKLQVLIQEQEEEEKKARIGPGGLDPVEVFESLPEELQKCFEERDIGMLQQAMSKLPPEEARHHLQRCIDSGLWVPDAKTAAAATGGGGTSADDEEPVLSFNADTLRFESTMHEPKRNRNVFLDVKPVLEDNTTAILAGRRNAAVFNNRVGFPPVTPKEAFVNPVSNAQVNDGPLVPHSQSMVYESSKPIYLVLRALGVFPYTRLPSGETTFMLASSSMIYCVIFFLLLTVYIAYILINRIEIVRTLEGRFEESVIAYLFIVNILPILIIPLMWYETRKVASVVNGWVDFETVYRKTSGRALELRLRTKALLIAVLLPILCSLSVAITHVTMVDFKLLQVIPYCVLDTITYMMGGYWYMTCETLSTTAKILAEDFQRALRHVGPAAKVSEYRSLWLRLSKLSRDTGFSTCYTFTFICLYLFFIITLSIYGLMSQISEGFGIKDIGLAVTAFCSVGLLFYICDEAHYASFNVRTNFQKKLLMVELSWMNTDAQTEINMFLRATEMNPSSINLGGFFDVNRTLFKSLLATMVTYLVVLLQFQISIPDEPSAMLMHSNTSRS
ncbi:uncharacterized protein LOC128721566 [Anopheles nili]|uniref:uncharacterized protein LOC128721566 n=1 Tax=Anopheles nili TaxID=185578 RepID=UPI00237B138D|nr:uncharacterized protein LOC128721566 [Anopheles nili]